MQNSMAGISCFMSPLMVWGTHGWGTHGLLLLSSPFSTQPQLKMGLCTLAQSLLTRMPHLVRSGPGPPVENGHEWLPYQCTCHGAKSLTGLNWAYTQGPVEVLNGATVDAVPPAPANVTHVHAIKHAPAPARHGCTQKNIYKEGLEALCHFHWGSRTPMRSAIKTEATWSKTRLNTKYV